jgi:hypothetical protein
MMRRSRAALLLLGAVALGTNAVPAATDTEAAQRATALFGQALTQPDASLLRSILPSRGKVQLKLALMGPEEGFFSSSQVEVLLRDFLGKGAVKEFEFVGVEHDEKRYALVHTRAMVTDRQGRSSRVALHLAFQPEGETWVLREIRETPP